MSLSSRVIVAGVDLEVRRWPGRGTPILLLHGALSSISTWRDFPAQIANATQREVIAWSRRGYGSSELLPRPREPEYLQEEAEAVPPLLDALGVDHAHLYGHSDGASIALLAAALSPARVASLVLEAPHVLAEERTVDMVAVRKMEYETTDLREKLSRHHANVDHVFQGWSDIWLDPRMRHWNIEKLLPRIRAPILLIQGLDDEFATMDQIDRIQAVAPWAQRLELQHCGHAPHREQPQTVLDAIATFLHQLGHVGKPVTEESHEAGQCDSKLLSGTQVGLGPRFTDG
jgi:pimeloyl-ACP methyl ester carboxylesterase